MVDWGKTWDPEIDKQTENLMLVDYKIVGSNEWKKSEVETIQYNWYGNTSITSYEKLKYVDLSNTDKLMFIDSQTH